MCVCWIWFYLNNYCPIPHLCLRCRGRISEPLVKGTGLWGKMELILCVCVCVHTPVYVYLWGGFMCDGLKESLDWNDDQKNE